MLALIYFDEWCFVLSMAGEEAWLAQAVLWSVYVLSHEIDISHSIAYYLCMEASRQRQKFNQNGVDDLSDPSMSSLRIFFDWWNVFAFITSFFSCFATTATRKKNRLRYFPSELAELSETSAPLANVLKCVIYIVVDLFSKRGQKTHRRMDKPLHCFNGTGRQRCFERIHSHCICFRLPLRIV